MTSLCSGLHEGSAGFSLQARQHAKYHQVYDLIRYLAESSTVASCRFGVQKFQQAQELPSISSLQGVAKDYLLRILQQLLWLQASSTICLDVMLLLEG